MKQLLVCRFCEEKGIRQILGEIRDKEIIVMRFHLHETRIIAENYSVRCGNCGEVIFMRKGKHESRGNGLARVYR